MFNRKRMLYFILLLGTTIKRTKDRLSSKKQVTSTGQGNIREEYQRGMLRGNIRGNVNLLSRHCYQ